MDDATDDSPRSRLPRKVKNGLGCLGCAVAFLLFALIPTGLRLIWRYVPYGPFLLVALGLLIAFCATYAYIKEQRRRRRQGYWVTTSGDAETYVVDYHEGSHMLSFGGDRDNSPTWVGIPTKEEWQQRMPGWARTRRGEILERIQKEVKWVQLREEDGSLFDAY